MFSQLNILEAVPDQPVEFSEDILSYYLDSFMTTGNTDDDETQPTVAIDDETLSAGAIAGIVITTIVVVICVMVAVLAVSIYCHRKRQSIAL